MSLLLMRLMRKDVFYCGKMKMRHSCTMTLTPGGRENLNGAPRTRTSKFWESPSLITLLFSTLLPEQERRRRRRKEGEEEEEEESLRNGAFRAIGLSGDCGCVSPHLHLFHLRHLLCLAHCAWYESLQSRCSPSPRKTFGLVCW